MTKGQKAAAFSKASELAAEATKTCNASYNVVLNKLILMSKWQAKYDKLMLDAKDQDIIQTDIDLKSAYDAEVVSKAELKAELDALKAEHAKAQAQLTEYRQALAELSKTNSKLVKDIAALLVCGYRCAKIEDTYKCGHNDNFGNPCDIDNCNILRANGR